MGRPSLPVGTYGNISFRTLGPKRIRALTWVRDADGRRRQVTAIGRSEAAARVAVQQKISARTGIGGALTGESRVSEVAGLWIADIERQVALGELAPNTARVYRSAMDKHLIPAVGALSVREATVSRLSTFIATLREHNKASITKTVRAVLSGVMGYATRHGACDANPVRDIGKVRGDRTKAKARAMTREERDLWLAKMEADPVASRHDLPDLTQIMLATGIRIGECLALSLDDMTSGDRSIAIDWNIVRVTGHGLRRDSTKSHAGERTLKLPGWAIEIIKERGDARGWTGPLFPNNKQKGSWRDPSNTSRSLKEARDRAGFGWVTSHVFRKTVATVLDEAGLTAREIADQLGHAKISMTQDVYLGRSGGNAAAAAALDDMFGDSDGTTPGVSVE